MLLHNGFDVLQIVLCILCEQTSNIHKHDALK